MITETLLDERSWIRVEASQRMPATARAPGEKLTRHADFHRRRPQGALFLRNAGNEKSLNLTAEQVLLDDNPPTREQGTDRPGCAFKRAQTHRRSGVATTDWHELEEHRFAQYVAAALEELVRERGIKRVIVAAPPKIPADLRQSFHADVRSRIIAEIDMDLTNHPVAEIERHLAA
jgi:protein required for attachment to host cells